MIPFIVEETTWERSPNFVKYNYQYKYTIKQSKI